MIGLGIAQLSLVRQGLASASSRNELGYLLLEEVASILLLEDNISFLQLEG